MQYFQDEGGNNETCQLQYRECKFSILSSPININMGMKDKTCYKPLTLSCSGDCSILN